MPYHAGNARNNGGGSAAIPYCPDLAQLFGIPEPGADMAYVPVNRTRALIICTRPQDYAPSRVHAAACYLEALENATAEESEFAKSAHLFLQQARRELPE